MPRPLPPGTHAPVRRLTVLRRSLQRGGTRYVEVPDIHLRGQWLAAHGFRSGHTVDVACEDGKLVITLSERQRFPDL